MNNINVDILLERILLDFKDFNPVVYKGIILQKKCQDFFEWWISINDSLCIFISGTIYKSNKGNSTIEYTYNNKTIKKQCYLQYEEVGICYINPKHYNVSNVVSIRSKEGLKYMFNKIFFTDKPLTIILGKSPYKYINAYNEKTTTIDNIIVDLKKVLKI